MSWSERAVRPASLPELTGPAATSEGGPSMRGGHPIREAHRIASAIIARANAQAREIEAAAEESGRERGRREALEAEGTALHEASTSLVEAMLRLTAARQEMIHALQEALPGLATAVAERILRRELATRPETLAELIRDALTAVTPAARVTLRVHPEDAAALERHRQLLQPVLGSAELRWEAAPEVGRGGCVIETDSLTLAAGLPQQVERALGLLAGDEP